ncbi:MAG: 50S ribosomal protein L13 [Thermoplasmataceae archaeon]
MIYIDADNAIYGRLSTYVAKQLLYGEGVVIVNAEKVVITGTKPFLINRFKERREIGSVRKGPAYPKTADQILRRSIKNMLPSKTTTGKEALRRCVVYRGKPKILEGTEFVKVDSALNHKKSGYVTLQDITFQLGQRSIQ